MLRALVPCRLGVRALALSYSIIDAYSRVDPAERPVKSQYFLLVPIKDVCRKAPMRLEHLSRHGISYAMLLLC